MSSNETIVSYTDIDSMDASYGNQVVELTHEMLDAIRDGKGVAFDINGGEYGGLIILDKGVA